jgi:hypothetical protein
MEPDGAVPPVMRDPMLYTVECSFSDPASEPAWNTFYSLDKLPALISVRGFHTSQRFKALGAGCPTYLAVHSIDGLHVLESEQYRSKGGGNFARWQQHIVDWHRNLYDGLARAPAIGDGEALVASAIGPDPLRALGLAPQRLQAVALEAAPAQRWLARLADASSIDVERLPAGVHLYVPLTAQLVAADDAIAPAR